MKRSTKVGAVAFASAVVMGIGMGEALAGVNQPPVCNSATHDIAHNAVLNSTVAPLCSDPDQGATLTYGLGENAVANGVLNFDTVTGAFTYTPNPGFVGTDDFTFFADDGFVIPAGSDDEVSPAETSAPATITINVAAQVTTTTTSTSTTVAVAPTTVTVLARTGVDNATTAGSGLVAIGLGLALVTASAALVTKTRKT